MSEAILRTEDVSIEFKGLRALDAVDFQVERGEIVGILGPNGAGKTTFFNCVCGFYAPTRGRVHLFGQDVTAAKPEIRAQMGLGRTFQQVGLVRSFTVLDNLVVAQHKSVRYGLLAGLARLPWVRDEERELRRRAHEVLEFMGLGDIADLPVNGLPYGTLKMVETAAVLATDPEILMLDEPLAGTGPEEGQAYCDRLKEMRRELGLTIIMIEHHVPLVLGTSDYVYVLESGQLLAEGTPDEIRTNRQVAEAYMGAGVDEPCLGRGRRRAAVVTSNRPVIDRSGEPMLRVGGLRSGYGSLPVLHGVSFEIHPGEIVVLLGLNGAGKSTTVKALCGALPVWEGTVTYKGRDAAKWDIATCVKAGITMVPEGRHVFPELTVEKNLLVGSWSQRHTSGWFESQRDRVFEMLPRLAERQNQLAGTLSGGEQQMLAIGRGLMSKPELLIIDEASLGLAPVIVKEIFRIVRELRDESGVTVILVEQNVGALEIADLGIVIGKGVVEAEIRGAELDDPARLRDLYMG